MRLLVQTARGLSSAAQQAAVARDGGSDIRSVAQLRLHVIEVPAGQASAALSRYQHDSAVSYAELDHSRKAAASPSDPSYSDQWALPQIGWDTAYGTVTPSGSATIAVVDTGVDGSNEDLSGRLVDGWSAFGTDPTTDPNGHGTWVSSIAAAATDNGSGIAGVDYAGAKVMPIQALDSSGQGQDSDVVAGVTWAADHGADVILMAFSDPSYSQALQDAVEYAWSQGAVVVAATGNGGSSTNTYPAGDAKVVGVSATDSSDALWSGSNYGQDTFLAAPGVGVVADAVGGGTKSVTGTSASAAIVAGTAALLKANDSSASNGTIVGRLARNADPAGTASQTGNGRVNVARALADTDTSEVVPVGTSGALSGGPFVGPYTATASGPTATMYNWGNLINAWQSSTLNVGDADMNEGDSIPYRFVVNSQAAGSHTVALKMDFSNGSRHFVDSFTSYDRTVTSGVNPCVGISGCSGSASTFTIPAQPASAVPASAQPGGDFSAWNATITGASAYTTPTTGVRQLVLTYTVAGGTKNVVIAFGAHLARQNEWGPGNGAAGYPGGSGKVAGRNDSDSKDVAASINPGSDVSAGGVISGTLFNDADGSGTQTAGDTGLANVTLSLSGTAATTATTQSDGTYAFSGLGAGTYAVDYAVPPGYANTGVKPLTGITLATDSSLATGKNFFARQTNTTTVVTSNNNPSTYGDSITFTGTVTSPGGNPNGAGSITFNDGSTTICASVALTGNSATCSTSTLDAGTHSITAVYSGASTPVFGGSTSAMLNQIVNPKSITGSFTADNKVYDGTTGATIATRGLTGLVGSDVVSLSGGTATFDSKDVGTGKTVTLSGASLAGTGASNYTLGSVNTTTANITAKSIIGSFTTDNKTYDGNTSATVLTRSLDGVVGTDDVSLSGGTATFDTKNVGTGKTVTLTGASLSGTDASNYTLGSVNTTTANITARGLVGSFTVANKTYDGNTSATVVSRSVTGAAPGDDVSLSGGTATFDSKDVGTGKTVTLSGASLAGTGASNYTLGSVNTTTANIT
ncbi:MAG TPA: YDG domain-containing protein, partial [Mycobacteriales bacterium]|nr:YDG domain-containing protein [Mycobacteriales bacterium]